MQEHGFYAERRQGFFSQVKADIGNLFGRSRGYSGGYAAPPPGHYGGGPAAMPPPPPPLLQLGAQPPPAFPPEQGYWPPAQHGLSGIGSPRLPEYPYADPRVPEYPYAADPRNYMSPTGAIKEVGIRMIRADGSRGPLSPEPSLPLLLDQQQSLPVPPMGNDPIAPWAPFGRFLPSDHAGRAGAPAYASMPEMPPLAMAPPVDRRMYMSPTYGMPPAQENGGAAAPGIFYQAPAPRRLDAYHAMPPQKHNMPPTLGECG